MIITLNFYFLENNQICKSNVIPVSLPLDSSLKGATPDGHFPYITINNEATPTNTPLESRSTVLYNTERCFLFKRD
jgi:hypothetical protein